MKNVKNKLNKELIKELPRALFEGPIEVVESIEGAKRAVAILKQAQIIGLDTETRPNFRGGRQNKVALLQVSTHNVCYLFRLKQTGMTDEIVGLLTNPSILKVGLSLRDDFRQLRALREFDPINYVELQDFVKPFGIQDLSLQKLYANILGGQINKGQQLSNWEAETLTDAQQKYAATDAWACILLFEELQRMRHEGFHVVYDPDEVPEPVFVGLEKPEKENESVSEDTQKEELKPTDRKKRKSKKNAPKVEASAEVQQTTSEITPPTVTKNTEFDNTISAESKNKRNKKRKTSKTKNEVNETLSMEAAQNTSISTPDNQKRSKRSKNNVSQQAEKRTDNGKTAAQEEAKASTEKNKNAKSRQNGRGRRSQVNEKRRDSSRRPIPEMAAPLDEEPSKKKGGFMKKMLLGIVEKFS